MPNWLKQTPIYYFFLLLLVGLWVMVTGLSLFNQLTQFNLKILTIIWLIPFGYLIGYRLRMIHLSNMIKKVSKNKILSLLFLVWGVLLFVQGVSSAPNTTDAMTYHLPRVLFWLSEKTVFPDSIYTINDFLSPFGDYLLLVNLSLFGSDQFLFLVQFLSGLGCLFLVYQLSIKLFKNSQLAWKSVIWAAFLPSLALQMVSTQIELVTSLCILLTTAILVDWVQKQSMLSAFTFPIGVALALLTKITTVFFLPIWVLYFLMTKSWQKLNWKTVLVGKSGILHAFLIMSLFLLQNYRLYQHPLGELRFDGKVYSMTNEKLSGGVLVSNVVRNSFIHLPIPVATAFVQQGIEELHTFLNQPLNDSRTTWLGTQFQVQKIIFPQEDLIGNPIHFIVVVLLTVWLIFQRKRSSLLLWLTASFWIFMVSFGITLKWQPWHSRLHLPIFMLMCIVFPILFKEKSRLQKVILTLSGALSFLIILFNFSHPYFPYIRFSNQLQIFMPANRDLPQPFYQSSRFEEYFAAKPEWHAPVLRSRIGEPSVNQINSVCFDLQDGFEYPFWWFLKHRFNPEVQTTRSCDDSTAQLQIVTTNYAAQYVERNFACFPTDKQDKFLCWKEKNAK